MEYIDLTDDTFEKKNSSAGEFTYPLKWQILLGIVFAALELGANYLQRFNPIPLYMDTTFTIASSFFGGVSGLITAAVYQVAANLLYVKSFVALAWALCSLTIVLIIRVYIKIRKKIEVPDLILLVFLISLIISLEGATIFTVLNGLTGYNEDSQVKFMYEFLSSNRVSEFISALLPRIPVNLLDKAISVTVGYLSFRGVKRVIGVARKA